MPFKDRSHAGAELAKVAELDSLVDPIVVALPRGAVTVAIEVARRLGAPLSVIPVEEISTPGKPEYIVGAVASRAVHVIQPDALAAMGVTEESLALRVAEATARIAKLNEVYRGHEQDVVGRDVLVVDDGSATQPALDAVATALTRDGAARTILLTPGLPPLEDSRFSVVITPARDDETVEALALAGGWYADTAVPCDESAAEQLQAFNAANN